MNLITYLSESRGLGNSARRLGRIGRRFGLSHAKMRGALHELVRICEDAGATPTLFVTAILIERYPDFFRELAGRAELAVHGYVHTDHALLGEREQYEQLERALEAFQTLGLAPKGFRHPYLRYNDATWSAAERLGFTWASNGSVHWDVVGEDLPPEALGAYFRGLRLYGSQPSGQRASLPAFVGAGQGWGPDLRPDLRSDLREMGAGQGWGPDLRYDLREMGAGQGWGPDLRYDLRDGGGGGILDIPASLPDDEAVIDRLGLSGGSAGGYWLRMLDQSYERGEVMTLVVHNERVPICANSLRALLRSARRRAPKVWVAPLSEINAWWRRRASWRMRVEREGESAWRVIPPDDHEATVLVRNADTEPVGRVWDGEWETLPPWPFVVHSEREPLVVDGPAYGDSAPADRPPLTFARWPGGARSALAITSDVDAMTLLDFLRRPLEV